MAYTYSRNMTDSSVSNGESGTATNPYNRHYDWGNNTLIPRQRFVPTVLWEIPYGRGKAWGGNSSGVVNAILGGWELPSLIVLQTGTYFSPTFDGSSCLQVPHAHPNRPNCP